MAHPFTKMFDVALRKSSVEDNRVLMVAEGLLEKGYPPGEIFTLLKKLHAGLIDDAEAEIVREATEEFSRHVGE